MKYIQIRPLYMLSEALNCTVECGGRKGARARGGGDKITPRVTDTIEHHCQLNFGVKFHPPCLADARSALGVIFTPSEKAAPCEYKYICTER